MLQQALKNIGLNSTNEMEKSVEKTDDVAIKEKTSLVIKSSWCD